jgi:hypothetical protein
MPQGDKPTTSGKADKRSVQTEMSDETLENVSGGLRKSGDPEDGGNIIKSGDPEDGGNIIRPIP